MAPTGMPPETCNVIEVVRASAKVRSTITYGEVGQRTGLNAHIVVPHHLGVIWRLCEANELPHLNTIVVSANTRLPGDGYKPNGRPVTWEEYQPIRTAVSAYDWASV